MMKRLLLICVSLVCVISCKKDVISGVQNELSGKWELRAVGGTIAGIVDTLTTGNGNLITFSSGNQYNNVSIITNDTIVSNGIYKLTQGSNCYGGEVVLIAFLPNQSTQAISVSGDTMHIDDNCVSDGVNREYIRIK